MKKADERKLDALKVSEAELLAKVNSVNLKETLATIKKESASILDKVDFPDSERSQSGLTLIMLYLFKGRLIDKGDLHKVGESVLGKKSNDWQAGRHLAAQSGFYILGKGSIIPSIGLRCPSGYYILITLDSTSPKFNALKRADLLEEDDFENIKIAYGNRCAHCSSKEGEQNFRDNTITKLQKSHLDPQNSGDVGNMFPLCDYCNRQYKDTYTFLPNGAIDKVNMESERVARLVISRAIAIHGKAKVEAWL